MFRHIAFRTRGEMEEHFRSVVPMHAYHSAAYYQDPGIQPMARKVEGWMGADLIFDLDADHIPGAEQLSYEQQLDRVKVEVGRLVREFLLDDMGFPASQTYLYFSGGRGYHVHIRDPTVLTLGSKERRAIVDYITGRGFSIDVSFPREVYQVNRRFGTTRTRRNFRKADWGGWTSKVHAGKDRLIFELSRLDRKERVERLRDIAIRGKIRLGDQALSSIDDSLFGRSAGKSALRLANSDIFDVFPSSQQLESFLRLVVAYSSVALSGETDEPVTTDTKRLIRVPGSLHGKTGLKVTPVPLDSLEDFDPLRDAVALPDDRVEVILDRETVTMVGGERMVQGPGRVTLPLAIAYFLVARSAAKVPFTS